MEWCKRHPSRTAPRGIALCELCSPTIAQAAYAVRVASPLLTLPSCLADNLLYFNPPFVRGLVTPLPPPGVHSEFGSDLPMRQVYPLVRRFLLIQLACLT